MAKAMEELVETWGLVQAWISRIKINPVFTKLCGCMGKGNTYLNFMVQGSIYI